MNRIATLEISCPALDNLCDKVDTLIGILEQNQVNEEEDENSIEATDALVPSPSSGNGKNGKKWTEEAIKERIISSVRGSAILKLAPEGQRYTPVDPDRDDRKVNRICTALEKYLKGGKEITRKNCELVLLNKLKEYHYDWPQIRKGVSYIIKRGFFTIVSR